MDVSTFSLKNHQPMGNKALYIVAIVCMTVAAIVLGVLFNRVKANESWSKLREAVDEEAERVKKADDEQTGTT